MSFQSDYFLEIWSQLDQHLNKEEMEEVAMLTKHIWMRRNSITHNKGFIHPNSLIKSAEALSAFRIFQGSHQNPRGSEIHNGSLWEKPHEGIYKVN